MEKHLKEILADKIQYNESLLDYKKLHEKLNSNSPVNFLFTGDSITQGVLHTNALTPFAENFSYYLRQISPNKRQEDIVINTGISGATSGNLVTYKNEMIISKKADVVFISIGMNDAVLNPTTNEQYMEDIRVLVAAARDNGAIPVLMTQNSQFDKTNKKKLYEYFLLLWEYAQEEKIIFVDINRAFRYPNGDFIPQIDGMNDAVHPDFAGHVLIAQIILTSLGLGFSDSELDILPNEVEFPEKIKFAEIFDPAVLDDNIEQNTRLRDAIKKFAYGNEVDSLTAFIGGRDTMPELGLGLKNYSQIFDETFRWEYDNSSYLARTRYVVNAANINATSKVYLSIFEARLKDKNPDLVFILPEVNLNESVEDFTSNINNTINEIEASGATVFLITPATQVDEAKIYVEALRNNLSLDKDLILDFNRFLSIFANPKNTKKLFAEDGSLNHAGQWVLAKYLIKKFNISPMHNYTSRVDTLKYLYFKK